MAGVRPPCTVVKYTELQSAYNWLSLDLLTALFCVYAIETSVYTVTRRYIFLSVPHISADSMDDDICM